MKAQFAMPKGEVNFINGSGCVSLAAGKKEANLSDAYRAIGTVVEFLEGSLKVFLRGVDHRQCLPVDMFGAAELVTGEF